MGNLKFFLLSLPVWLSHGARHLLGQSAPILDPGIGSIIGNVGVVGALVWFMWYVVSKAMPSMTEAYERQKNEQRVAFAAALEKQRTTFETEQREERADRTREREENRQELEELRTMLYRALKMRDEDHKDIREVIHTGRDILNSNALAKAVGDAEKKQEGG